MFTGVVQSFGYIENIDKKTNTYIIKTNLNLDDCKVGSSICCDGVCLTATKIINDKSNYFFLVNVGEETIKRSNIINWKKDILINIEKSLKVGDEISGHFVYGHVDMTLKVKTIKKKENSWEFDFTYYKLHNALDFKKYIVEKGSVAINGISLTIASVFENYFSVSIIPHTFINTNLSKLQKNDLVNIEFDPLARYINERYGN